MTHATVSAWWSDPPPAELQGVPVRPGTGFACGALPSGSRGQRRWRRVTMRRWLKVVVGGYSSVTALAFGARDSADEQAAGIGGEPMQQRRTAEEPAPPRTYRPLRQIVVYLCITYGLTLAIALALPHAGKGDRGIRTCCRFWRKRATRRRFEDLDMSTVLQRGADPSSWAIGCCGSIKSGCCGAQRSRRSLGPDLCQPTRCPSRWRFPAR